MKYMKKNPSLVIEQLPEGNAVAYDPQSENTFILNHTATIVWENCEDKNTSQIASIVIQKTSTPPEYNTVLNEIEQVIDFMIQNQMISRMGNK